MCHKKGWNGFYTSFWLSTFILFCSLATTLAAPAFEEIHTFMLDFKNPSSRLVQGKDGDYYGTTSDSGLSSPPVVYKVNSSGTFTAVANLYSIRSSGSPSGLMLGRDGNFYGTISYYGTNAGSLYKCTPAGTLTVLADFPVDYGAPIGRPLEAKNGNIYGATSSSSGYGTIYRYSPDGQLATLYSFDSSTGYNPVAGLVEGSDGALYGSTTGSSSGLGTIFKLSTTGIHSTLFTFVTTNGASVAGELLLGKDGFLYGTAARGGVNNYGTLFKISTVGVFTRLALFDQTHGITPYSSLIQQPDGTLFGTTQAGGSTGKGVIYKFPPGGPLSVVTNLYYSSSSTLSQITLGNDGNIYGITQYAGNRNLGTVFKIDPFGTLSLLKSFGVTEGINPYSSLVIGQDGAFYGSTHFGGLYATGTVFRFTPGGQFKTLVSFDYTNGAGPKTSALIQTGDGMFYGTTQFGGSNGQGTVFKMSSEGQLTSIYSFNKNYGYNPRAHLTLGSDGFFYGTTEAGTSNVFKMSPSGTLSSWTGVQTLQMQSAWSSLLEGSNQTFFGAAQTSYGPIQYSYGGIYKLTASGLLSKVFSFSKTNGMSPNGLIRARNGIMYGTTQQGGKNDIGSVFSITESGEFASIASFANTNGNYPYCELIQARDGYLYGTTLDGGTNGYGVVFKVDYEGNLYTVAEISTPSGGRIRPAMVEGPDGNLYGTLFYGGLGAGSIFRVNVPLRIEAGQESNKLTLKGSLNTSTLESSVELAGPWTTFDLRTAISNDSFSVTVPLLGDRQYFRFKQNTNY